MVAVTPTAALLMASRMPASESLLESMVTVLTPEPAVPNAAPVYLPVAGSSVPPVMVPKSKLMTPLPMGAMSLATPPATSFCDCASWVTLSA